MEKLKKLLSKTKRSFHIVGEDSCVLTQSIPLSLVKKIGKEIQRSHVLSLSLGKSTRVRCNSFPPSIAHHHSDPAKGMVWAVLRLECKLFLCLWIQLLADEPKE